MDTHFFIKLEYLKPPGLFEKITMVYLFDNDESFVDLIKKRLENEGVTYKTITAVCEVSSNMTIKDDEDLLTAIMNEWIFVDNKRKELTLLIK